MIEERVDTSIDPDRQFIWGLRYVDDILLRDRDTTGNGTLDERLYGMQDANWNVSSIASAGGVVQERYGYHPYGTPVVLTGAFAFRDSSDFHWETMFAGYRWESEVSLFDARNRVYVPHFSWVQRDALGRAGMDFYEYSGFQLFHPQGDWMGFAGGTNLYQYGNGNPLLTTDPSGYIPVWAAWALALALGCAANADLGLLVQWLIHYRTGAVWPNETATCNALSGCFWGVCVVLTVPTAAIQKIVITYAICQVVHEFICDTCVSSCDVPRVLSQGWAVWVPVC